MVNPGCSAWLARASPFAKDGREREQLGFVKDRHTGTSSDNVPFEIGQADLQALSRAKFVYVAHTFSPSVANRDIQILRNEVDHGAVQGIWVQRAEGVLIQGNRTHHNGATGIQIESLCRRIWLDGNISYANCTA